MDQIVVGGYKLDAATFCCGTFILLPFGFGIYKCACGGTKRLVSIEKKKEKFKFNTMKEAFANAGLLYKL